VMPDTQDLEKRSIIGVSENQRRGSIRFFLRANDSSA
jgi:hypothetical protein